MSENKVLKTKRLILRPWEETDAESLYQYAKDPLIGPITGWPSHESVEQSLEVIRNVLKGDETYAVCLKEDNKAIGCISLMIGEKSNLSVPDNEGELGYWIGVPFWGKGLIPEGLREVIRHAFLDLGLSKLWCGYFDGNLKSKRCMEKCGFKFHHTNFNIYWKMMDDFRTEHVSRLTREEWVSALTVRKMSESERKAALSLTWEVFSVYEAPDYPVEGTEEFKKCLSDEEYLKGIDYYGAFDKEELIGVLGIRRKNAHICFFFVEGRYHRLGIGTRMFDLMKEDFMGMTVTVNSSPYGVPFYDSLGFKKNAAEQMVNGIRFTPMILRGNAKYDIVRLCDRRELKEKAARWFSGKWSVPEEAYLESIEDSFSSAVPSWYLALSGDGIIAGMGVIENDFHDRKDLTPNVCAVYTEEAYRNQGIAGRLLNYVCDDMKRQGISTLYLLTDHNGFYERYGWEFYCMAQGDGEEEPSRMYIHRAI